MSNIADIAVSLTILERCIAEVLCQSNSTHLEKQQIKDKLREAQNNNTFNILDTAYEILLSDDSIQIDTLISDSNIKQQMARNIKVAHKLFAEQKAEYFKANMIKCVLSDLDLYVKNDATLIQCIESNSQNEQASEIGIIPELTELNIIERPENNNQGEGATFYLIADIILQVDDEIFD